MPPRKKSARLTSVSTDDDGVFRDALSASTRSILRSLYPPSTSREEGEFTIEDAMSEWNKNRSGAQHILNRLMQSGTIERREWKRSRGHAIYLYRKVANCQRAIVDLNWQHIAAFVCCQSGDSERTTRCLTRHADRQQTPL